MARNAEKAMTTLARWRAAQLEDGKPEKKRRPFDPNECTDLADAERFRLGIIREISKKVTQIQNAGLGEFKIRDLNDHINRLLRDKRNWEGRIKQLGGADFKSSHRGGIGGGLEGPRVDAEGREVPGSRGYKYFGAAKDLPGVRELFALKEKSIPRKTRAELMKNVDPDYYGWRDEDDGVIVPLEAEVEIEARMKAVEAEEGRKIGQTIETEGASGLKRKLETDKIIETTKEKNVTRVIYEEEEEMDFVGPRRFVSHVPSVPTQEEVQAELLRRKKIQLLQEYLDEGHS